jgi:hypothetical protein
MGHPIRITTLNPSEEMGKQIMCLRYDLMVLVLRGMAAEAARQAAGDLAFHRPKLGLQLTMLSQKLQIATFTADDVVRICQPYIDKEKHP